jgi:hypothetical protein
MEKKERKKRQVLINVRKEAWVENERDKEREREEIRDRERVGMGDRKREGEGRSRKIKRVGEEDTEREEVTHQTENEID